MFSNNSPNAHPKIACLQTSKYVEHENNITKQTLFVKLKLPSWNSEIETHNRFD